MSATLQSLGLDKLTVAERLALIGELWESLEEEPPVTRKPTSTADSQPFMPTPKRDRPGKR